MAKTKIFVKSKMIKNYFVLDVRTKTQKIYNNKSIDAISTNVLSCFESSSAFFTKPKDVSLIERINGYIKANDVKNAESCIIELYETFDESSTYVSHYVNTSKGADLSTLSAHTLKGFKKLTPPYQLDLVITNVLPSGAKVRTCSKKKTTTPPTTSSNNTSSSGSNNPTPTPQVVNNNPAPSVKVEAKVEDKVKIEVEDGVKLAEHVSKTTSDDLNDLWKICDDKTMLEFEDAFIKYLDLFKDSDDMCDEDGDFKLQKDLMNTRILNFLLVSYCKSLFKLDFEDRSFQEILQDLVVGGTAVRHILEKAPFRKFLKFVIEMAYDKTACRYTEYHLAIERLAKKAEAVLNAKDWKIPEINKNLIIYVGDAGTGKDTLVTTRYGDNVLTVSGANGSDSADLKYKTILKDGKVTAVIGDLYQAFSKEGADGVIKGQKVHVVNVSESARIPVAISSEIFQKITDETQFLKVGEDVLEKSDEFKVILTCNYEGEENNPISDALLSRVAEIRFFRYDNLKALNWAINGAGPNAKNIRDFSIFRKK